MPSKPPSSWEFAKSWLRYERDRWRGKLLLAIGRCPGCPKTLRGPHKFGCYKPKALPSMRSVRKNP